MNPILQLISIGFQLIFAAVQIAVASLYIVLLLPFVALWKIRKPLCRIIIRLPALIRGLIFYARRERMVKRESEIFHAAQDCIVHPEKYLVD